MIYTTHKDCLYPKKNGMVYFCFANMSGFMGL